MGKSVAVTLSALIAALALGAAPAAAQDTSGSVLLYTGTTGFRHTDAIDQGRPVVQQALEQAGFTVDWEDCSGNGGGAGNCDHADENPRVFTDDNLANYDAIMLFNASGTTLWNAAQRAAIIRFVQNGGGIAANHNSTDMGGGQVSWDWWDGGPNSAVGTVMKGHAATSMSNEATVQVADRHHLSTRDLPDTYEFGDEHYNFARSVRGTHHVLATLDERTYTPGNPMGQDHPISWCKLYDGDSVEDGTGTPKPYNDGRVWTSAMGHFGALYTENGGDNELVKQIVGGVRWVAGEGKKSDCTGTVWSSFKRTILVSDVNGPIGLDVAPDGKVFWSEIGPEPGYQSEGYLKMHDPLGEPNNKTTVVTIPTRADHGSSEDGVLGMSLEPGFDLADPTKRDVFVYYSPRNSAWPTNDDDPRIVVGYNQISRFTLNAEGTAVVPGSERVILRVPKAKISGSPSGFPGGPQDNGPGHVGGAGLDFDSEGNLYLGVGDDVAPNAPGHGAYPPLDYRATERWDARKTSANSADLRGKVLRIKPLDDIAAGAEPGVDATYSIPAGNMFTPGTPQTRPEIYAMGFRQPFTLHADPQNPGAVVVGEYCHDAGSNDAQRAPAGVCEWNLVDEPAFHGWPFCMGDNAPGNTSFRWDYAANTSDGLQRYDCSQSGLPSDIRWAPDQQTAAEPTFDGLDTLPGPAAQATVWMKGGAPGGPGPLEFGDLSAGGRSPVTGPIYRYDADNAEPGAFPAYYDGSWFITNRGSSNGFWKEVRLRSDDNEMLRVNDWIPAGGFGAPGNSFVIPSKFGPDGALYMARWTDACCRGSLTAETKTELVKIESAVQDECLEDTQAPTTRHRLEGREHPDEEGTYLDSASLVLTAVDAGCAGVESIEYRVNGGDWQPYSGAVDFEPGEYTVDYRATDEFGNDSAVEQATFTVVRVDDDEAPTVSGQVSGTQNEHGHYAAPARLAISASDGLTPISSIEYRVNQVGEWTKTDIEGDELTAQIQARFAEPGFQYVELRATDRAGNVSGAETVAFSVYAPCRYQRTDEFDGPLDGRWLRHTRNGGTPTSGPLAPTVANGQLTMPTNDQELDGGATGPVNFLGQDLHSMGDDWEVETQFTVEHNSGWQMAGLIIWNGDNNLLRSTITHHSGNSSIYVEQTKDNPPSTEGAREPGGGRTITDAPAPITIRMRYAREAGADTFTAQYRIMAPAELANADWVDFPGAEGYNDLNPAGGPRRDDEGSRIGLLAAGNFGSGTPANVVVDYFRVTPDQEPFCPVDDVEPPATTLTGAEDGGVYDEPVELTLSAADTDHNTSGVAVIEHRVDGGPWQESQNTGSDDPFETSVTVDGVGEHTVDYRSRDEAGNLEAPQAIGFTIVPPSDVRDVFALGAVWSPDAFSVPFGQTVTWHFDEPDAQFPHDVWLVPPGGDPSPSGGDIFQVTGAPVPPGGDPVEYTFRRAGTWDFICRIHSSFDEGSGEWSGMVGTVDVGEDPDPGPDPDPDPDPDPEPDPDPTPNPSPGPGGNPSPGPAPGGNPFTPPVITPEATAARLSKLRATRLAAFRKKGLKVRTACEAGERGSVKITVSRKQARRRLGVRRAATLARKSFTCGANDRKSLRLKPTRKAKRQLRKARGRLVAKVQVSVGSTSDSRRLVLKR